VSINPAGIAVFEFIDGHIQRYGYAPTIREISRNCFMAPSTVLRYLDIMQARGWISRKPKTARSICILKNTVPQANNDQTSPKSIPDHGTPSQLASLTAIQG
jgi:SOS-response transcriptional repressor LexA